MEERQKKINIENIYEDMTTLKLKQYKLIMKKKDLGKKFEVNRLLTSDKARQMTHWDVKLLSLDVFEERKWKKGIYYILGHQIATKVKKSNRKKKFDELYKKCMCLYLSININNNMTDISMGKENKNMTEKLSLYIKSIANIEDFSRQLIRWKESLGKIKAKLEKKFGERNINKTKNVFKVINLMENMLNMQEENVKRINVLKELREKKAQQLLKTEHVTNTEGSHNGNIIMNMNMTNFIADIDSEMSNNEQLNQADDSIMFIQNNFKNLDMNNISKELNDVMEQISNEVNLNDYDDSDICLNTVAKDKIESPSLTSRLSEIELIMNINPKQLFYDSGSSFNITHSRRSPEELRSYLEKLLKLENEKTVEILPTYNYLKVLNTEVDENKVTDEFTKIYFKVFPSIFSTDKSGIDKDLLESEIELYRTKYDRILKDSEHNKLFNFKFGNFTQLQKLVLIWAVTTYGSNPHILSEIPNIFTFSKSISYDIEEIFIELDKLLHDFNVDLLASSFDSVVRNSPKLTTHYIYSLDPPMLNSTQCNFYYNKKMLDFVKDKRYSINNTETAQCYPTGPPSFSIKKKSPQTNLYTRISLIQSNPIFKTNETRQSLYKLLKEDLKKICLKVETLYESSLNNFHAFDFQMMARKSKEKENVKNNNGSSRKTFNSNGYGLVQSSVNMPQVVININKNELLNTLVNCKVDFCIGSISEKTLDNTRTNLRQDPLEGVSFYSQQSIQREWENLRSPWYQNNTQFKPKFRKPFKTQSQAQPQLQINPVLNSIPNMSSSNNNMTTFPGGHNFNMVRNLNDNRPDK